MSSESRKKNNRDVTIPYGIDIVALVVVLSVLYFIKKYSVPRFSGIDFFAYEDLIRHAGYSLSVLSSVAFSKFFISASLYYVLRKKYYKNSALCASWIGMAFVLPIAVRSYIFLCFAVLVLFVFAFMAWKLAWNYLLVHSVFILLACCPVYYHGPELLNGWILPFCVPALGFSISFAIVGHRKPPWLVKILLFVEKNSSAAEAGDDVASADASAFPSDSERGRTNKSDMGDGKHKKQSHIASLPAQSNASAEDPGDTLFSEPKELT